MDNIANIQKNGERYEMYIDGVLKAYTKDDHVKGKIQLIDMAKSKGYIPQVEEIPMPTIEEE